MDDATRSAACSGTASSTRASRMRAAASLQLHDFTVKIVRVLRSVQSDGDIVVVGLTLMRVATVPHSINRSKHISNVGLLVALSGDILLPSARSKRGEKGISEGWAGSSYRDLQELCNTIFGKTQSM